MKSELQETVTTVPDITAFVDMEPSAGGVNTGQSVNTFESNYGYNTQLQIFLSCL